VTDPALRLPPPSTTVTVDQQHAAGELLAFFTARSLSASALSALGTTVQGYDLKSIRWKLKGRKEVVWLEPFSGVLAMDRALADAAEPQRARLGSGGRSWVKDSAGRKAEVIPADLPPPCSRSGCAVAASWK
jgi:hypothetical protein